MAEESVSILKVDTAEAVKSVNDLKENIKLLKERLGELTIGEKDYQDTLEELKVNQNALKDAMYGTSASMEEIAASAKGLNVLFDENNQLINQGNQSYNALVHTMAELKQEWRATSDEARRAELGEQIAQINTQLKGMDASVGNFQRNVGNYSSALDGLEKGFSATAGSAGSVINPIKNVTMGLKALSATPVIGILGLLANVLSMIIKNLHSSEENSNRLTIALAPLKDGALFVTKAFQALGKALASVAEWFTKVLDKFGLISEEGKKLQEITKEEIALAERRREVEMENADAQLEIAKLRAKAAEKDKYTAKERLQFIEEAAQKEREIADRNIELARREYDVLKAKSDLAGNSKEENDKLAEAYVNLQQAETNYFNKTRELNAQRIEAINAIKAETKANEELLESKAELADFDKALAKGDSVINARLAAEKAAIAEMDAWYLEEAASVEAELYAMYEEEQKIKDEAAAKEKKRLEDRMASMYAVANATSSILSSLADMYEADEKNSEKNAKKIKALRIASATIDMLQGAITAFTSAQSLGVPFGQIVGAVNAAAVIAMGVANINKIKAVKPGSDNGSVVATAPVAVNAPNVETQLPTTRNLTSASEEERLNRMASSQKVYILQSDIEAAGMQSKAQVAESSF